MSQAQGQPFSKGVWGKQKNKVFSCNTDAALEYTFIQVIKKGVFVCVCVCIGSKYRTSMWKSTNIYGSIFIKLSKKGTRCPLLSGHHTAYLPSSYHAAATISP